MPGILDCNVGGGGHSRCWQKQQQCEPNTQKLNKNDINTNHRRVTQLDVGLLLFGAFFASLVSLIVEASM